MQTKIPRGVWVPIDAWIAAVSAQQQVSYASVEREIDRARAARSRKTERALSRARAYAAARGGRS